MEGKETVDSINFMHSMKSRVKCELSKCGPGAHLRAPSLVHGQSPHRGPGANLLERMRF